MIQLLTTEKREGVIEVFYSFEGNLFNAIPKIINDVYSSHTQIPKYIECNLKDLELAYDNWGEKCECGCAAKSDMAYRTPLGDVLVMEEKNIEEGKTRVII